MMRKNPILSARSLCKDYRRPNGNTFPVLEGINLDIFDGEFIAVVGLSGSGKSTLLKCLAGLLPPDRGRVTYSAPAQENRQTAGFVFQSFSLFPWMTVHENVAVSLTGFSRAEQEERTQRILQTVGLKGYEDAYPRDLSGGMRQRVSLARAMVADPMILFMDDPFVALDPLTSESLRAELIRLWSQQDRKIRAAVLVTHRFDDALQLADRIFVLSSNPGTIFQIIEVPLPRPRTPASYREVEEHLEHAFGQLHLDKINEEPVTLEPVKGAPGAGIPMAGEVQKLRPLVNTSLTLVEGLVSRLSLEATETNIYDLCEEMGQSIDQVLPAVVAAETLGFLTTPGVKVVLTSLGRELVNAPDASQREALMRQAMLRLPLIWEIYKAVTQAEEEGYEASEALERIALLLPFEDHDVQFQTLLRWCRYANLLVYDEHKERLFLPD